MSVRALKSARSVRQQLEAEVRKATPGTSTLSSAKDLESICRAVTAGFFNNAGARCGAGSSGGGESAAVYKHMEGLMPNEELKLIYVHPTSVLAAGGVAPQYVIYHELVYTARPFMRHVLGVERGWLMECRARIGKATLSQLSGGALRVEEEEEGEGEQGEEKGSAGAEAAASAAVAVPAPAVVAPKEKTSQEALEAARRRFLERKQQQAAQKRR